MYDNLKKNAYISAFFYLEEDELDAAEFAKVRKQFSELVPATSYQIYGIDNQLSYGKELLSFPVSILDEIRIKESLSFIHDDYFCYGIFYEDNQGDFVVITKEDKALLAEQTKSLFNVLLLSFIVGLLAIIILSKWIAHIAYRPFRTIIRQVNTISTNNLEVQIESPNTKDELQDLIDTFNDLLTKISEVFAIQKNFVSYVSHEFKTPLTAVLGNLEVFSIKDRTPEEYNELSEQLIEDIHQLEDILESLLVVSDLQEEDSSLSLRIRIDELIWEVIAKLRTKYSRAKIEVEIVQPIDEEKLYVTSNKPQLSMALVNLIDNAIKYSNDTVHIKLVEQEETLCLSIADKGRGIPANQLNNITKPFFRADNANEVQGLGIGLSIAFRILEKHHIAYCIESGENKGTKIDLQFNN